MWVSTSLCFPIRFADGEVTRNGVAVLPLIVVVVVVVVQDREPSWRLSGVRDSCDVAAT